MEFFSNEEIVGNSIIMPEVVDILNEKLYNQIENIKASNVYSDCHITYKKTVWEENTYTPNPDNIIFFDWENDGKPNHVGIVEKLITTLFIPLKAIIAMVFIDKKNI